jgi:sulfur-carrier protein
MSQPTHQVWIPALHRDLTGGVEVVEIAAASVGEIVRELDARFPGMEARLCDGGRIRPYISVAVNGEITRRGLHHRLREPSEIHFVPSLGGGTGKRCSFDTPDLPAKSKWTALSAVHSLTLWQQAAY